MPDQAPTIKQQRDLKQEMKQQRRQAQARQERTRNIVTWSIIGLVVAGIVTLIIVGRGGPTSTNASVPPISSSDYVRGVATAPAVLIEYSDFQCPACGAFYPIVRDLERQFGSKLAVVYRNFPLAQHQYAQLAAQAAGAAGLQGKFFEMHDLLFERQTTWSTGGNVKQTFIGYAQELGLDVTKFTTDIDSQAVKDRINADINVANGLGVNSTPTFYLNGKKINAGSEQNMVDLINAQLGSQAITNTATNTNQ